jgi:NAD(P)-dependent dehydrogenase (short-subunit alcohol dehydrogenase family)
MIFEDLADKTIILTGAHGQLGVEIAKTLNQIGDKVVGIDKNKTELSIFHDYFEIDIGDEEAVNNVFNSSALKDSLVHGLVNNAGFSIFTDFTSRTKEDFFETISTNLWGPFLMIKKFSELMAPLQVSENNWRSIVNLGSIYGHLSPDFKIYGKSDRKNSEIYGASKAGLIQMTRYFSVALADSKIRVNSISPGGILNDRNPQSNKFIEAYSTRVPMKRLAEVTEISGPVLFLLSRISSYINGTDIVIDGGLNAL